MPRQIDYEAGSDKAAANRVPKIREDQLTRAAIVSDETLWRGRMTNGKFVPEKEITDQIPRLHGKTKTK